MADPKRDKYTDIRQEMRIKQLPVSLIQAINRIRCRKVIDPEGNCEAANVFIVLPKTEEAHSILENIRTDMPDIKVVD
jgi:hypothetical protein